MQKFVKKVRCFIKEEDGVTAIEYGLIAALIGVTIAGTVLLLGQELNTTFTAVDTKLSNANGS
jgi:pilus assembly protein Flp/PilA